MSMPLQFALVYGILAAAGEGHAPENDSIRKDRLKADLVFLWGDAFRGAFPPPPRTTSQPSTLHPGFLALDSDP